MKAHYNPEGDPCLIDTEVEILAWDGDKWITFKNSIGEVSSDKLWKFSIKRSNKLYKLPRGYMDDVWYPRNRDVAEELKALRKRRVTYTAILPELKYKEFKTLSKALRFCSANASCERLQAGFMGKRSSLFAALIVKEGEYWYFYTPMTNLVSTKTLNNWVMSN